MQVATTSTTDVPFLASAFSKAFLRGGFGLAHSGGSVNGPAGHIASAVEDGHDVGYLEGMAVEVNAAAVRSGGCFLAHESGGSHLSAGHAVDSIVNKDHNNVFATVGGVYTFSGADSRHVAVALICEHGVLRPEALQGSSHSGGARPWAASTQSTSI